MATMIEFGKPEEVTQLLANLYQIYVGLKAAEIPQVIGKDLLTILEEIDKCEVRQQVYAYKAYIDAGMSPENAFYLVVANLGNTFKYKILKNLQVKVNKKLEEKSASTGE